MNESNARIWAHNTYSLDTIGVLAHLRDTTHAYAARIAAVIATWSPDDSATTLLPRSRVGPATRVIERHSIPDAWRIR